MEETKNKKENLLSDNSENQPLTEVEAIKITANDRLRKHYPDEDPQTEEDWENLRNKFHDETEQREKDFSDLEKEVNDLIASDEDLALILNEMLVNKLPFRAALAKVVDVSNLTPIEGEDDYEAYNQAYNERVAKTNSMLAKQKEIDENATKTFETLDAYCQEKGYDDAIKDELLNFINQVFDAIVMKDVSKELLAKLDNARTYDSDITQAAMEGEIRGRNANIEAQRADDLESEEGDGIPTPTQAGGAPLNPIEKSDGNNFWSGVGEEKKWK